MVGVGEKKMQLFFVFAVIALLINGPIVSALQISNVRAEDVTDTSTLIRWDTDEPADSFVYYGENIENLRPLGDASLVQSHELSVSNLQPEKEYLFSVKSNNLVDDNDGDYYLFTTPEPDVTAPVLSVPLAEFVQGARIDISGTTEAGANVKLTVNGQEQGTLVAGSVSVDDGAVISSSAASGSSAGAGSSVPFTFADVSLQENQYNTILVEASDRAGNRGEFTGRIFADASGPRLELQDVPTTIIGNTLRINGTITENSSIEIFVNNRSVYKEEGVTAFAREIQLDEGSNKIEAVARDRAGWESREIVQVTVDSQPPRVEFEIVEGTEYYEGRASTDITGTTKPKAKVFLYIFSETTTRGTADFTRALDQVEADDEGKFVFEDVSFPPAPFTSWKQLAPRQVPAGLEEILISPLSQLGNEQRKSYKIYIIAEDSQGRTDFAPAKSVNVNTCFTGNAFDIMPLTQFQAPFRLDPGLMEEGRESIQAVFNITYRGGAVGTIDPKTGQEIKAYEVIGTPRFQRACTQSMSDSDDYALGCKLLPSSLKVVPNYDKTGFYVTADLQRADEFVDRDEENDPWKKFQKSKLKLPIKMVISYKERNDFGAQQAEGTWSQSKTEVFCYDLSYFVDVPIESSDMIPDVLVDTALPALNETITAIESVKPYLKTAMMVAGFSCVGSFFTNLIVQVYRQFISHYEPWLTRLAKEEGKKSCPDIKGQYEYYLEDTIEGWKKLKESGRTDLVRRYAIPEDLDNKKLEDVCPKTASAWEVEEFFDQFYRFTCDRFFCRAVPAGWTSEADETEINNVIQEQLQCSATASGAYLEVVEDCRNQVEKNPTASKEYVLKKDEAAECYRNAQGVIYYVSAEKNKEGSDLIKRNIWTLSPVGHMIKFGQITPGDLLAYRPPGSDRMMVAPDVSCSDLCERVGDYEPVDDGYQLDAKTGAASSGSAPVIGSPLKLSGKVGEESVEWIRVKRTNEYIATLDGNEIKGTYDSSTKMINAKEHGLGLLSATPISSESGNFCYEMIGDDSTADGEVEVLGQNGAKIEKGKVRAGYSRDCFVNDRTGQRYQCVCKVDEDPTKKKITGKREAVKEVNGVAEPWSYREDAIYRESFQQFGTYYSKLRYYSGRDFSGAFGLDFGFDNFRTYEPGTVNKETVNEKTTAAIDPHTQTWGAFQSVCLTGINARLEILQSILIGMQKCIVEAKYTGLHDAGMCKTIFTQYVCSLFYKFLSSFTNSCSPISLGDFDLDIDPTDGGLSAALDSGFGAIPRAISSSQQKITSDYANSNLKNFFATGTQGFAESLCLAAFGYDFPMGMDFIMDSAYSFSSKTSVLFPIASRELSNFNPAKGTATFNYNLAGTILPGCNIRGYKMYLKCIEPADTVHPNVQCPPEGCDCLQTSNLESPFKGEKTFLIQDGTAFTGLDRNQMFDLPIPSPQKVSSNFRYDHVVVEVYLDQGESADSCFDDGYKNGNGGIFYFPITPIQSPAGLNCFVDGTSGKFICPEIKQFFGGSTTYFEYPYLRCKDADADEFVPCETNNLFLRQNEQGKSDQIVVKPFMQLGGEGACLEITESRGLTSPQHIEISPGLSGPFSPTIDLGSVSDSMTSGGGLPTLQLDTSNMAKGCKSPVPTQTPSSIDSGSVGKALVFRFKQGDTGIKVIVPEQYSIANSGAATMSYTIDGSDPVVMINGNTELERGQINAIEFQAYGFKFSNVLGDAQPTKDTPAQCVYTVKQPSYTTSTGLNTLSITTKLFKLPETGSCGTGSATVLFPKGALGLPTHTQSIVVQDVATELAEARSIHAQFLQGKYPAVISMAELIIANQESSYEVAKAFYYHVASLIMQGAAEDRIKSSLNAYFTREFTADAEGRDEFKKIDVYMCQIDQAYGGGHC